MAVTGGRRLASRHLEMTRLVPPTLGLIPAPDGCRLPGFVRCFVTVLCSRGLEPPAVDAEQQAKAFLAMWAQTKQMAPGLDIAFELSDLVETVLELTGKRGPVKALSPLEATGFHNFLTTIGFPLAGSSSVPPVAAVPTMQMEVGSAAKERPPLAEMSRNTLPATMSNMLAGSKRAAPAEDEAKTQTPAKRMRCPPDSVEEVLAWVQKVLPCDADRELASQVIRQECIDGEALLGMQPEEVKSVLGLQGKFACAAFQKALADVQVVEQPTNPPADSPSGQASQSVASTPRQSLQTPSEETAPWPEYEAWRAQPQPPCPAEVAEWLLASVPPGYAGWEAAERETIQKVASEQHVDAKALCAMGSLEEAKEAFRLQNASGAKLWEKIQMLKLIASKCPWGFPSVMPTAGKKRVSIVVLGDTGAGKSTSLNALMGEKTLLPTNGMRACTAAIVELSFNYEMKLSAPYLGQVEFVSKSEWADERKRLYSAIRGKDGELLRWQPPDGTDAHMAWCKLRSVYGCIPPEEELIAADSLQPRTSLAPTAPPAEVASWLRTVLGEAEGRAPAVRVEEEEIDAEAFLTLSAAEFGEVLGMTDSETLERLQSALKQPSTPTTPAVAKVAAVLGMTISESAVDAASLHATMSRYVDSSNDSSEGALWPLVKRVQLKGPWDCLAGGAVLVDAPGVQDDNSARDAVVKRYLRSADGVWLMSNIRRAVNDKTVKDYLVPKYKQELVEHGLFGQLAFIATQTDILEASEIAENLGLPEGTSKVDCARARNAYTKKRVVKDFYQGIDRASNATAGTQFTDVGGRLEDINGMPPASRSTAALNAADSGPQTECARGHWGVYKALKVKDGVEEMRWTDNGCPIRDSICTVAPPKELLLPQQSQFTLPVVTVSAVDYQRLAGICSSDGSSTFTDFDGTEILALRGLVHGTVRARRAHIACQIHSITEVSGRLKSFEQQIRRGSSEGQQTGQPRLESGMVSGRVTSALFSAASRLRQLGARRPTMGPRVEEGSLPSPTCVKRTAMELSNQLVALCDATAGATSGGRMLQILEDRQAAQDCEDDNEEQEEEGCADPKSAPIPYHLGPLGFSFSEPEWTCQHKTAPPRKRLQDFNPGGIREFAKCSWNSELRRLALGRRSVTRVNCMVSEVSCLNQVATYIEKQNFGKITINEIWSTAGGWASYRIIAVSKQGTLPETACSHTSKNGEKFCPSCGHPRPATHPAAVASALANGNSLHELAGIGFTAPICPVHPALPPEEVPKSPNQNSELAPITTTATSGPQPASAVPQDDDVIDLTLDD